MSRETLVFQARLAQQCGRDEDLLGTMRVLTSQLDEELSEEERALLSVALKNVLQRLRSSITIAKAIEMREHQLASDVNAKIARAYVKKLCLELLAFCEDTIAFVRRRVDRVPGVDSPIDARVFYLKLLGDYYRYICEIGTSMDFKELGIDRAKDAAPCASNCYRAGIELASALPFTDPTRLGLYLNETVFLYEIMGNKRGAIDITQACLNQAIEARPMLENDESKLEETEAIIQLLSNNLTLWTQELEHNRVNNPRTASADHPSDETLDLEKLHLR